MCTYIYIYTYTLPCVCLCRTVDARRPEGHRSHPRAAPMPRRTPSHLKTLNNPKPKPLNP